VISNLTKSISTISLVLILFAGVWFSLNSRPLLAKTAGNRNPISLKPLDKPEAQADANGPNFRIYIPVLFK
jgi:hypothetical protein